MAEFYKTDEVRLKEYAHNRAEAMVLQDKAEESKMEADWSKIEELLKISFNSLHRNIQ